MMEHHKATPNKKMIRKEIKIKFRRLLKLFKYIAKLAEENCAQKECEGSKQCRLDLISFLY